VKLVHFSLVSIFTVLSIFASLSYADLSNSDFLDLIKESEIIAIARADKPDNGDCAKFQIVELLKGTEQAPAIEIKSSPEVHDQKITKEGMYLLFLKKHDGVNYSGTHYGRSYWSLDEASDQKQPCNLFTPYTYPINTVVIKSDYLTGMDNSKTQIVCLGKVKQAISDFL